MPKLLWTQKQDIGPPARFGHAMTFEAARKRVVLFGGEGSAAQSFGDTWAWDGEDWTQLEDIGPGPRFGHAMAYDGARDRIVLFGGRSRVPVGHQADDDALLGDTWEWDGTSWTQVQDTGPSTRQSHAMVYDEARKVVVLFGGIGRNNARDGETWTWDGSEWTQTDETGPSVRSAHALAYDRVRARTVLFGGQTNGLNQFLGDTWEWDGNLWTKVQDIGPGPSSSAAMVFRTTVCSLFGGYTYPGPHLTGLTWEWDGTYWTARQDIGVGARGGHAMAFDSGRGRVVLFGGVTGDVSSAMGDTWEHPDVVK